MTRLSHAQWTSVHQLSLEVHLARNEREIIELVLLRAPGALGINYTVWHQTSGPILPAGESALLICERPDVMCSGMALLNKALASRPTVAGLEMPDGAGLPDDTFVATTELPSDGSHGNTTGCHRFHQHPEDESVAAAGFWQDNRTGVMICFYAPSRDRGETKLMIHQLRQHLSVAFLRFSRTREETKRFALTMPDLEAGSLTRRERETLPHLLHGKTNSEIATILGISDRTVEKHVASIIRKTGAENRITLISEAKYRSH